MHIDSTAAVRPDAPPPLSPWAELARSIEDHIATCEPCLRLLSSGFAGCETLQALEH